MGGDFGEGEWWSVGRNFGRQKITGLTICTLRVLN